MRNLVLFLAALMAFCGSAVALFATAQHKAHDLRGYVDPTIEHNLPFRSPRLGINVELLQYTPDQLEQQLQLMDAAHIVWIRQFFRWDQIEPQPGVYNWEAWDQIVNAVAAFPDMNIVAVLTNSPPWSRAAQQTTVTAAPDDPTLFAAFARTFAERYGSVIDHYQIWDEPNLTAAWGGLNPRPSQYAALLSAAYESIHAADPEAEVIAAALAPTTEMGPENISDLVYLDDLYALGAQRYMDAAAGKPYGFDFSPHDRRVEPEVLNFSRIIALREIMVRHGDGQKALWASNWGWNSLPDDWQGKPSIWGSISEETRTTFTLSALDRAEREWPWLAGMILSHWQPQVAPDNPAWGFALLDTADQPGTLYHALEQRPPALCAQNGLFAAANRFARYSGVWTFSALGADIGWINDSSVSFDFCGRDIALLLREDDYVAYLYPTIDGAQSTDLPRDSEGNPYIILTSDSLRPETSLVTVSRNLAAGPHTLHVVADELVLDDAQDRWAIIGFAVSDGNLAAPYDRQMQVAILSMAVSALAVIATGWRLPAFRPAVWITRHLSDAAQLLASAVTSLALMMGMLFTWGGSPPALFRHEPVQLGLALLSAGLVYIEPGLFITLVSLGVLFVIFYNRPDFGLILVLFWSPFFLFPVELYRFAFPLAEVLILLTAAAWTVNILVRWGRWRQSAISHIPPMTLQAQILRLRSIDWAVIAWVGIGILSLSWTTYLPQAITELRVMMVEPALFYLIMRTIPLKKRDLVYMTGALLLAGVVVALIGLVLFVQGEATITAEAGARRLASVYGSPNNVGLFLGRCIPFVMAWVLLAPDRRQKLFSFVVLLLMLATVGLSQSAGAIFLGVPASIVAVLVLVLRRRALPAIAVLGAGAAGIFALLIQIPRFARLLDFTTGTNFARIRVWQSALSVLSDHPLTGLGLDQFLYAFRGRYIMPDAWQEPNLSHPHNFILDFWIRLGIFGVIVFVWIQIAFWRAASGAYTRWRNRDKTRYVLVIGAMGCMVNLLAHGLVDNSVYVNDLAMIFVFTLGLVAALTGADVSADESVNLRT